MSLQRLALLLASWLVALGALAGQNCEPREPKPLEIRLGLELALKVQQHLDAQGARAAVVARAGRDLGEYGLRYSHVGLALRVDDGRRWVVLHLLNRCNASDSDIFEQGLGNFFLDGLFRYEALVLVPSGEMQARLAEAVRRGYGRRLHELRYSLVAHPYSRMYQNSNQWLLELIASTLGEEEPTRAATHARLERAGYQPALVYLPPSKRLGARLFTANTRFDDHTSAEMSSSRFQIVSAESVTAFLAKVDRTAARTVIAAR